MKLTPTTLTLAIVAAAGIYYAVTQNSAPKNVPAIVSTAPAPSRQPVTVAAVTTPTPAPVAAPAAQPAVVPVPPVPVAEAPATASQNGPNAANVPNNGMAVTTTPAQPDQSGSAAATGTNTASAVSAPAPATAENPPPPKNEIRMNFQGASLNDVLNYLSEAAGFIVIQDTPVTGTVNIISKQPVKAAEAVDLLNSVLINKGYTAILNGRVLKIVSSHDALRNDLPVNTTSDPDMIPKKDTMVTQILPIRYVEATKLIENLRPLLSADASISSNENSNAIILTDTQTNIHRIAEIIHSLDNSISSISSIHVFQLRYADAKDFANVLTQLFNPDQASTNNRNGQQNVPPFFARFGGGGRGGGGDTPAPAESEARKAASRVIAVPDTQSNSVVVSAPEEYMATITDVVERLDVSTTEVTETRIFRLEHADCQELANVLNSIYGDATTTATMNTQNNRNGNNNNRVGFNPQQQQVQAGQVSDRQLQQARVAVAPDPRTNSVIVNCSHDTMEQISLTIGRLDSTDAKKQHVYVVNLQNADPDNLATILRGMFGGQNVTTTGAQPTSSALNQRTQTGASSNVTSTLNTNSTAGGNR